MTIETEELLALSDVMSAKRMREMEDEIFRLESEVQQWKESANSCQMQVSLMREEPNQRMHEGCLVLSYNKLRDALERISDFSLSSTLSAILLHCLPHWATAEDSDKVAKLVTLFPIEIENPKVTNPSQQLPKELMSDEAIELKEKLMDGGFIDENWQPNKLTITESAMIAKVVSERLSISDPWQFYSKLWGRKSEVLRTSYYKALDQRKTLDFQDRLKGTLC
jgi:hypothetical protein